MGHIGPKGGMADGDVTGIAVVLPTMAIDGDAIIGIAHEDAVDAYILTTEDVDAVVIAPGADGFEVFDMDLLAIAHQYGIGIGDDGDAFNGDVAGVVYSYSVMSCPGLVSWLLYKNTVAIDTDILLVVDEE